MKVSMIYMASGFGKRYGTNKLITEFRRRAVVSSRAFKLAKRQRKIVEKTEKRSKNCQLIPHQPV